MLNIPQKPVFLKEHPKKQGFQEFPNIEHFLKIRQFFKQISAKAQLIQEISKNSTFLNNLHFPKITLKVQEFQQFANVP